VGVIAAVAVVALALLVAGALGVVSEMQVP
jgi:hypothetical protein